MQQCYEALRAVQSKAEAAPFLEPVDWEAYGLHDYPEIIKNPMDLGTIEVPPFLIDDARTHYSECAMPGRASRTNWQQQMMNEQKMDSAL